MGNKPAFRQNISIPADLKRRMDKVSDQVNWSAIACAAFEIKLGEIAATKERKDMNDVIQRLRGLAQEEANEMFATGKSDGEDWAKQDATPAELRRLAQWEHRMDRTAWEFRNDVPLGVALFAEAIDDGRGRWNSSDFWEGIGASEVEQTDPDYVRGFCAGAVQVWNDVKEKI
jgi:hypothetical protein